MTTPIIPDQTATVNSPLREHLQRVFRVVQQWDHFISLETKGGKPLFERVLASAEDGAFLLEFAEGDEQVYGYYPADAATDQPEYALSVIGDTVVSCNCRDSDCRNRLCKHRVWLAILGSFDLPGPIFPASHLNQTENRINQTPVRQGYSTPTGFVDTVRPQSTRCGRQESEAPKRPVVACFEPDLWK